MDADSGKPCIDSCAMGTSVSLASSFVAMP